MSKNPGKRFEEDFEKSIPENIFVHRVKDMSAPGYFGVRNICDYMIYTFPTLYLLELKSTKGASLPFSRISDRQYDGLNASRKYEGIEAGLVFNFRDHEETYYVPIKDAYHYKLNELLKGFLGRKSFPLTWVKDNGVEIKGEKKITRYTYDTKGFFETMEAIG